MRTGAPTTPLGAYGVAPKKGAAIPGATAGGGFATRLDGVVQDGRASPSTVSSLGGALLIGGGFPDGKNHRSQDSAETISSKALKKLKTCQLALLGCGNVSASELIDMAESVEATADSEVPDAARLCRSIALRLRLEAAHREPVIAA